MKISVLSLRICLYLVDEDQCVVLAVKAIACQRRHCNEEVPYTMDILEQTISISVDNHVDFDEVGEKAIADFSDDIGLAYLTGSVDDEDSFVSAAQVVFDETGDLSLEHALSSHINSYQF